MEQLSDFINLIIKFMYNFITAFLIIRFIYYPRERKRDFFFTFLIFNTLIFFICFFLKSVQLNIGFAFGLFAIFSILRYRTETIPIREMTYQFVVITLGAVNGLANIKDWHMEILYFNMVIFLLVFLLDGNILFKKEYSRHIQYEKIDLIKAERKDDLMADLKNRTGLNITRIKIEKINFLKDTANIIVHYR